MVAACVCLAVSGTLGLASWLAAEPPTDVRPGDLDSVPEGTLVRMVGEVEEVRAMAGDFCLVDLRGRDGNASVVMLSFPAPDIRQGDRVRVTGRVAMYRGSPEVVVDRGEDLDLLERAEDPRVGLDQLMGEPWRYEGSSPLVAVVVSASPVAGDDGRGWWCTVGDATRSSDHRALLLLEDGGRPAELGTGDELLVRVAVRYDPTTGLVYLEALEVL